MRLNRHLNAILFLWGASFSARTAEAPPDLAALSRAAARETNHLETSAASWISIHQIDNGPKVFVHVLQSGHKHRWTLSAEYNGKLSEMLRITQRGDLWYLEEGGNRTINRPFEATLRFPGAYLYLLRSGLRFITDPSQLKDGKLESVEGHVATYRLPLPASSVSQMRNLLSPPTDFSDLRSDPRFVKGKALIEETLAHSQEIGVDLENGLVVESGTSRFKTRTRVFQWLDSHQEESFALDNQRWSNAVWVPSPQELNDCIMISYDPDWRPPSKQRKLEGQIFNLKTGRFHRIPFQGIEVCPGCFLKDRSTAIVCGRTAEDIVQRPYQVNLITGAHKPIGDDQLAAGLASAYPVLSPNGKTVAIMHKDTTAGMLETQIYLVELQSNATRSLGKAMDYGVPSWLPDGKALARLSLLAA